MNQVSVVVVVGGGGGAGGGGGCCCCWEAAPTVSWEKKKINHPHDNLSFNMSSKSMGLPISRKLFGLGQERWKTKKKMIVKRLNRKQIKNATHA